MKLPKIVQVMGRNWAVKVEGNLTTDNGEAANGLCDPKIRTLFVDSDLEGDELLEVFIHEWVHAIWFEVGINEEDVPEWVEHMIVVAISRELTYHKKKWRHLFT